MELVEDRDAPLEADRLAPLERPAGPVEAQAHRRVEVLRRRDALARRAKCASLTIWARIRPRTSPGGHRARIRRACRGSRSSAQRRRALSALVVRSSRELDDPGGLEIGEGDEVDEALGIRWTEPLDLVQGMWRVSRTPRPGASAMLSATKPSPSIRAGSAYPITFCVTSGAGGSSARWDPSP